MKHSIKLHRVVYAFWKLGYRPKYLSKYQLRFIKEHFYEGVYKTASITEAGFKTYYFDENNKGANFNMFVHEDLARACILAVDYLKEKNHGTR